MSTSCNCRDRISGKIVGTTTDEAAVAKYRIANTADYRCEIGGRTIVVSSCHHAF